MDFDGVAGVVAIHREGRDQQRAVDPDAIHCSHHVIPGDLRRAVENGSPGPPRVVAFVGMHLGIYG